MSDDVLTPADFDIIGGPDVPPAPTPSPTPTPPAPPAGPTWISYPKVADHVSGTTFFADIVNHYSGRLSYPDEMTVAHETTHMINADIRNQHGNGIDPVAFYVGGDQACFFTQPKMTKDVIAQFVPSDLRGDRFGIYVTGQTEWNDSPLYLYDEWIAYTNGGQVCVEQVQAGTYNDGWTDGVMGLLEFSVYATATVMAIEKYDPNYLNSTPDFLRYTQWCLGRAQGVYAKGSVMDEFKWDKQDNYLNAWKTSPDAADLRSVLTRYFGGVWVS